MCLHRHVSVVRPRLSETVCTTRKGVLTLRYDAFCHLRHLHSSVLSRYAHVFLKCENTPAINQLVTEQCAVSIQNVLSVYFKASLAYVTTSETHYL